MTRSAADPDWGPRIRAVYESMGVTLYPNWELEALPGQRIGSNRGSQRTRGTRHYGNGGDRR